MASRLKISLLAVLARRLKISLLAVPLAIALGASVQAQVARPVYPPVSAAAPLTATNGRVSLNVGSGLSIVGGALTASSFALPIASPSVLGGIEIGSPFTINGSGVLGLSLTASATGLAAGSPPTVSDTGGAFAFGIPAGAAGATGPNYPLQNQGTTLTSAPTSLNFGAGLTATASGNAVTVTGNPGTVTSVGLSLPGIFSVTGSPVTGAGTLTGTLGAQAANLVFAGPASGAAAAPTFRGLTSADLPLATASAAGATTIGGGLSVSGGTVSVTYPEPAPAAAYDVNHANSAGTAIVSDNGIQDNGSQVSVGGATAIDTGSRLQVAPSGTAENGLSVVMPSGATGNGLQVKNNSGQSVFTVSSSGNVVSANRASSQTFDVCGISDGYQFSNFALADNTNGNYQTNPLWFFSYRANRTFAIFYYNGVTYLQSLTLDTAGDISVPGAVISTGATHTAYSSSSCPLNLVAKSGQTADLTEWESNTAAVLAKIDASGNLTSPTVNATTGFKANGEAGYTGAIPPGNYIYSHQGIITGYGTGATTGLIAGNY